MWEKTNSINYTNWVTEKLEIWNIDLENKNTKNDLKILKELLVKEKDNLEWMEILKKIEEGITYDEIMELVDKYREKISPIISAIDYEWISNEEVAEWVINLEDTSNIDKRIIYFLMFWFFLKDR